MESKDDQIIVCLEKDTHLIPESIELRSLADTAPIKSTNAVYVDGIEIPIIQVDAIHVGKMFGNRFERIFIDDDLVNSTVRSVFDDDSPTQTTMIVNLDSDNYIVLYRGCFRRAIAILSIVMLVFFVITVVYIMIFHPV
jgi:hypothetical protein